MLIIIPISMNDYLALASLQESEDSLTDTQSQETEVLWPPAKVEKLKTKSTNLF